jgi:mediator of RNA polymerase II transcription subunit 8, fungi type
MDSLSHTLTAHFPPPQTNPSALVSYPLPSFPAHSQGLLLATLLNKKLNPKVQDWVLEALNTPAPANPAAQDELWNSARDIVAEQQDERNWYDDIYTLEEREAGTEGIETGVSEEGLAGAEGKKDEKIPGALKLEAMLRFMGTGVMPADQPPLPPTGVMPGAGPMKR